MNKLIELMFMKDLFKKDPKTQVSGSTSLPLDRLVSKLATYASRVKPKESIIDKFIDMKMKMLPLQMLSSGGGGIKDLLMQQMMAGFDNDSHLIGLQVATSVLGDLVPRFTPVPNVTVENWILAELENENQDDWMDKIFELVIMKSMFSGGGGLFGSSTQTSSTPQDDNLLEF